MIPIIVPTLNLDKSLLSRLLDSIDHPVYVHRRWNDYNNIGVAATWNLGPDLFPDQEAWIICNDDVQFEPGALGEFCQKVEELADKESFIMWDDTDYFACFAWTRVGVERFGLFDENFFPAYEEDADMKMRWKIAGYQPPNMFGKNCPMKHGKPQCGGPRYNQMIQDGAYYRRGYFVRKWGTLDFNKPVFKTPFNDPNKSLKDWTIEPDMRANLQKTWDDFINQPNPSIYT